MEDKIVSRVVRGTNVSSEIDMDELRKADPDIRLIAAKSIIKVDLTRLLYPITKEIDIRIYSTCDTIVNNLCLDTINLSTISKPILSSIITNEVYRILVQISVYTGKDYSQHIQSKTTIDAICDKLLALFRK